MVEAHRKNLIDTVIQNQKVYLKQQVEEQLTTQKVDISVLPKGWFEEATQDFAIEHGDDLTNVPEKVALDTYRKILLPMIRRAVPTMIASDICGVQPMAAPGVAGLLVAPGVHRFHWTKMKRRSFQEETDRLEESVFGDELADFELDADLFNDLDLEIDVFNE